MMNKHWVRTAVAAAMLAGSGAAMAEVTGNVAVVSDYLFDGITQTQNDPAVQGGVDWAMESGLYLGAWASNVDFDTESDVETDWYVGYGFGDENVSFDFGYVMYMYLPDDDDADYDEIYFGVTFAENTTLKYWHARDYFNLGESSGRFKITHDVALNDNWSLGLEFTRGLYDDAVGEDYNHYRIGVGTSVGIFDFDLSYHKTNADYETWALADEDAVSADGNIVLTISTSFGGSDE